MRSVFPWLEDYQPRLPSLAKKTLLSNLSDILTWFKSDSGSDQDVNVKVDRHVFMSHGSHFSTATILTFTPPSPAQSG